MEANHYHPFLTLQEKVYIKYRAYCAVTHVHLELSIRPDLIRRLVPPHAEQELLLRGIDIYNFTPIPLDQMKISPI